MFFTDVFGFTGGAMFSFLQMGRGLKDFAEGHFGQITDVSSDMFGWWGN